ncbi:MAG: family 10 glycosylhydrolase [Candidatus Sumerlaeaceae bacterium]
MLLDRVSYFSRVLLLLLVSISCCTPLCAADKEDSPRAESATARPDLEPLPTTGPLTAAQIGSGVWWRPVLNETSITEVLSDLEKWKFRNLYVESFWGCKTIFPSDTFEPRTEDGKDWLEHICTEAARHQIRVVAWVHTLYWHNSTEDATTPTLLQLHPDWIEITKDGDLHTAGDRSIFVSPALPQVQGHLLSLVDELCSRSIDGINLDYIRYNSAADFGYNSAAVEEFQSRTGIDPLQLKEDTDRDSDWMKWVSYREDLVTTLVHDLSYRTREHGVANGRRLLVTSAYFPGYRETRGTNRKYQNWSQWVSRQYLDVSNPMCYSPSLTGLEKELREIRSVHQGASVACVPGLAVGRHFSPHPSYVDQRKVLEGVGFRHAMVFKYETLKAELDAASQHNDTTSKRTDD